jgi:hypothetical protein
VSIRKLPLTRIAPLTGSGNEKLPRPGGEHSTARPKPSSATPSASGFVESPRGCHLELGCKIVDEGDRVNAGLGRYRRCECSGERDRGCGQKGTLQHRRLRGSVWWINDRTVCAADLLADIREISGGFEGRIAPLGKFAFDRANSLLHARHTGALRRGFEVVGSWLDT